MKSSQQSCFYCVMKVHHCSNSLLEKGDWNFQSPGAGKVVRNIQKQLHSVTATVAARKTLVNSFCLSFGKSAHLIRCSAADKRNIYLPFAVAICMNTQRRRNVRAHIRAPMHEKNKVNAENYIGWLKKKCHSQSPQQIYPCKIYCFYCNIQKRVRW